VAAPDYSFIRRPRWIAGHLIALVAIVVFVLAGLWQLSRLDEQRAINDAIEARAFGPAIDLPSPPASADEIDDLEWRLVEFDARWLPEDEVILRARSLGGVSGHDILTPARVGGLTVVVNRGWVPIDVDDPPVSLAAPAAASTLVRGVLRPTQERGSFGPIDPDEGRLMRIARIDLDRLDQQISGDLYPMWVHLLEQTPVQPDYPRLRSLPPLDDGPHLSYAVQWFVFAIVVVVGYPVLMIRTARTTEPEHRRHRVEG
jgi:surfeit locus 1 family protein